MAAVIAQERLSVKERQQRQDALSEAAREHRPRLLSMIRTRVTDQLEAEDVLQDVFEEFIETYDLGASIEKLGAWLMTVARNKILDRFRRKRTEANHSARTRAELEASPAPEADPASRPDLELTRGHLREELAEAIGRLPEEQRRVFVMHELEGKSFEEISAEVGAPLNTVLSRKRYAVLSLRNRLKEIYDQLEP